MVVLETSDSERFTVDKDVAERSVLIKQMLDGEYASFEQCGAASSIRQYRL